MYVTNITIEKILNKFGIEYDVIESKKIPEDIMVHHMPHSMDSSIRQMNETINILSSTYDYESMSNHEYDPVDNIRASFNTENINIITTHSEIKFDSDIIFELNNQNIGSGDIIEDILVCIDVPILNPMDNIEYIDLFEYHLIENLNVVVSDGHKHEIVVSSIGNYLYMYPIIYHSNASEYHQMTRTDGKKMKVLYQNNLIDVVRITIPLFLFKSKQNSLPIHKIKKNNKSAYVIIKMTSSQKIIKTTGSILHNIQSVPLLNVCLIVNYVNLATNLVGPNSCLYPTGAGTCSKCDELYLYDKLYVATVPIQPTSNPIYDTALIPLNKLGFIKDFFFTIIEREDHIANRIDKFRDELIEVEILNVDDNVMLHSRLDAVMMNSYIPLKKLGHKLPSGIYYYSFSSEPLKNKILGGLWGKNYVLRLKIKKISGVIKFYVNEYNNFTP